jgi:hypothetical protein
MMNPRRITRPAAVVVFFALVLVPVVLFGVTDPWADGTPRAAAAPKPFPQVLSASTFRRIAEWFNDRAGLRFPLLRLGLDWSMTVWQPRVRGSVILGSGSWLFWSDDETRHTAVMADARGRLRLEESATRAIDTQLPAVRASYAACGRQAFVVVAPNKQSIYPEELGVGFSGYAPSRLDGLLENLSPPARSMMIDLRPALRAEKSNHPAPLYYRTDTHWNALGIFYSYRSVVEALARAGAIDRPELASLANYDLAILPYAGGDMAQRVLNAPWRFPDSDVVLTPKARLATASRAIGPDRITFANPAGKGRLLMIGDSFAPLMAPFLARHFAEVTVLERVYWPLAFDGAMTAALRADVTLLETVERALPDLAAAPRNLDRACAAG